MAKIKKTRKDKMLADQRRQHYLEKKHVSYTIQLDSDDKTGHSTIPEKGIKTHEVSTSGVQTQNYSYLLKDLRKTMLVTITIVVVQIVLYFLVIK
jgi:hypothetical protein